MHLIRYETSSRCKCKFHFQMLLIVLDWTHVLVSFLCVCFHFTYVGDWFGYNWHDVWHWAGSYNKASVDFTTCNVGSYSPKAICIMYLGIHMYRYRSLDFQDLRLKSVIYVHTVLQLHIMLTSEISCKNMESYIATRTAVALFLSSLSLSLSRYLQSGSDGLQRQLHALRLEQILFTFKALLDWLAGIQNVLRVGWIAFVNFRNIIYTEWRFGIVMYTYFVDLWWIYICIIMLKNIRNSGVHCTGALTFIIITMQQVLLMSVAVYNFITHIL